MTIEFRCSSCGKLLTVEDDSAGKQAKCPVCATVLEVPPVGSTPPPPEPLVPAPNPFAASTTSDEYVQRWEAADEDGLRPGPPWEREGPSFGSFFATFKQCLTSPTIAFREMRRTGGLGRPIGYCIAGSMCGYAVGAVFQFAFQIGMMPRQGNVQMGPAIASGAIGMVCMMILMPLFICIGIFIQAAIMHVLMKVTGAARYPFETTFRVVCYTLGTTNLLLVVPICGQLGAGLVQLVLIVIGMSEAHETSVGRVIGAMAILFGLALLCCCLPWLLVVGAAGLGAFKQGMQFPAAP